MGTTDDVAPEERSSPPARGPASLPASEPGSWLEEVAQSWQGSLADQRANHVGPAPIEFMLQVRERLPLCEMYFKIVDVTESTFKIEALAFATVNGSLFAVPLRTSNLSILIPQEKMDSEVDLMVTAIAKVLGVSVLTGKREPVPEEALRLFVEPA